MTRIYHTSDLHDRRGFAGRLRALRERRPGLLFDCGDSLRGSQTLYYRNEPIVAELDEAGYDAQGIGNREFHCSRRCAHELHECDTRWYVPICETRKGGHYLFCRHCVCPRLTPKAAQSA